LCSSRQFYCTNETSQIHNGFGIIRLLFSTAQAIEVDKRIEDNIEYAHPVSLQLSTHRLLPREHFVLVAEDGTDRRLGAPIELENGLETLFVDHDAAAQITDRLRSYASHLQEVDRENNGRRQQPYEDNPPDAGECIAATLEENLRIASYQDVANEVQHAGIHSRETASLRGLGCLSKTTRSGIKLRGIRSSRHGTL
jgi:hypothetical protein